MLSSGAEAGGAAAKTGHLRVSCTSVAYYICRYTHTVEPPLKETPNKGNLSIMNRITCPNTSLSYSANTFITSEERKPL